MNCMIWHFGCAVAAHGIHVRWPDRMVLPILEANTEISVLVLFDSSIKATGVNRESEIRFDIHLN